MFESRQQRAAESLLGTPLPDDATKVLYHLHKPGSETNLYTAYVKFQCSLSSYDVFRKRLGLKTRAEQLSPHLPAAWALPRELTLDWWDALQATPENSAARSLDNAGWLVAKYENKNVYLIVVG